MITFTPDTELSFGGDLLRRLRSEWLFWNKDCTFIPEQVQSNTLLNSFVALQHHDQCTCPLQSQHVLNTKKHKPLGPVAETPCLLLSTSG